MVIAIARVITSVHVMIAESRMSASKSMMVTESRIKASGARVRKWSLQRQVPLQQSYVSVCKQIEWRIGMEFRYYDKMKQPYEKGSG
jgi:hypothetical protein